METEWIRGRCIGKGSFGTVSLAYTKYDGRVFAVKSVPLSPSSSKNSVVSLENEIEILRSLESSYIVSYLGDSTTEGWRNLHMEYVPGGTLADVAGALDEPQVRAYTRQIANALLYLHSVAGVVHSDVKGRNVLVGPTPGTAKLADFGSARRISERYDRPSVIGGTPLWMAPEVVRGEQPMPASDIWSLGCTVIEMITGSHPWRNLGQEKLFGIGFGDELPECPPQLSKPGRDFLDKCLRREASERWTAEQLLQHPFLAEAAGTETGRSPKSVLDWVNWGFDDEEEEDEEASDDVVGSGRERIRELAENNGGIVDWDSAGWEAVRYFGGEREGSEQGTSKGIETCCREELGNGETEASCSSSSCSRLYCCCDYRSQQVVRVRCLDWREVFVLFHVIAVNILVLQLLKLYRVVRLTLLSL